MDPKDIKNVLGEKEYERLFEKSDTRMFEESDLVKLSYFFRKAIGVKVNSGEMKKNGLNWLRQVDNMDRTKISESIHYVIKKMRKANSKARKIRKCVVILQSVFRGRLVRKRMREETEKKFRRKKKDTIRTSGKVSKDCRERKQMEKKLNMKKSVRRRSKGTVEKISEIKESRRQSRDGYRKKSRLFHSDWLKKFDLAFDQMVHESDRV
jgi:hypothetical protein